MPRWPWSGTACPAGIYNSRAMAPLLVARYNPAPLTALVRSFHFAPAGHPALAAGAGTSFIRVPSITKSRIA